LTLHHETDYTMKPIYCIQPDGSLSDEPMEVLDGRLQLDDGRSIAVTDIFWLQSPKDPLIELAALNAETLQNVLKPLPFTTQLDSTQKFIALERISFQ
jgi:hypothetical protein